MTTTAWDPGFAPFRTHEVFNQSEPPGGRLFEPDAPLRDALAFHAPDLDAAPLQALAAELACPGMQEHARLANLHRPGLHTHDRVGRRIDRVEFHPSYHALMDLALRHGLHGAAWAGGVHAHLCRAAGFLLFNGLEAGVMCPVSMSYAATPALRGNPALAAEWLPKLTARAYDPRFVPADGKAGVTMGMGMTEKQGGSDVRANTTRAVFAGDTPWGRRFRLLGHKWFLSAPMSDAFLVLAQADEGPSCFFVPRWLPAWCEGGGVNPLHLQRLKDKLGNHANASAEVEFHGTSAWLVGEPGRGVPQILEMGTLTRLDCALGTTGLMRAALRLAVDHAAQRRAFGRRLVEQPLMRNVLADLALEYEAALALALRLARTIDRPGDAHEQRVRRFLTPMAKFWICKRGAGFAQEAMECLGGNGYVEEGGEGTMARIYREMPVNSIWEGAGNIMALDLLRALRRRGGEEGPDPVSALQAELAPALGRHAALDRAAQRLLAELDGVAPDEQGARRLAQQVALCMQAALLQRQAPGFVFEAFCAARLGEEGGGTWGTLPSGTEFEPLIARAAPA